jgi:biofilm PGA synthesis lipoprotein PgaB
MKKIVLTALMLAIALPGTAAPVPEPGRRLLVLCYHDVPKKVDRDDYGVDEETFIQQLEYLRTHGYAFVSFDDVLRAHAGGAPLPPKAVLLTFDDAYRSFYERVLPVLKAYRYPCVLAVVSAWIDRAPPGLKLPLMNWQQVREAAASGLVEIATHTHNLHHFEIATPQQNTGFAAVTRKYDAQRDTYETEEEFIRRIGGDLRQAKESLRRNAGVDPRAVVWPYGEYNQITVEEARTAGYAATMTLADRYASAGDVEVIPRFLLAKNPSMEDFIAQLADLAGGVRQPERVLQADLDLIYDPDPRQQEKNLDRFLDRVVALDVNTVYLQAYCDTAGTGDIAAVYFPSRVLPMKADLFARVANRLMVHGIRVYAWMPMLSIVPPGGAADGMKVMEITNGERRPTTAWYHRLSPFDPAVVRMMVTLYQDLAIHANFQGVIFQDDGYLNDAEDFSPEARAVYRGICGGDMPYALLPSAQKRQWYRRKTAQLFALTDELQRAVRRYRPQAHFARTLYAPVLAEPASEEWFAQNYAESLQAYDSVVIMSYPIMEGVRNPVPWLKRLVRAAGKHPGGLEKTVFKVQTYDWNRKRWIPARTVNRWLRTLVAAGARHIAYYPDNYLEDKPAGAVVRDMMAAEDFPFERETDATAGGR